MTAAGLQVSGIAAGTGKIKKPASRRRLSILMAFVGVVLVVCVLMWVATRDARRLNEARRLRDSIGAAGANGLSREERARRLAELKERTRSLSPADRARLLAEAREERKRRLAAFFKMSPEEQTAALDRDIDLMEKALQHGRERARASGHPGGTRGADPLLQGAPGKTVATNLQARGEGQSAGQASLPTRPGKGEQPPRPPLTQDRAARLKQFIDLSTPEDRVQLQAYLAALNSRRVQRGLPSLGPPSR